MQNHHFYAFYPSDYDPRNDPTFQLDNGEYDSVIDVEERLDQIPYAPASERPAFDILFRALREWWRGHEDELDKYDDFTQDMLSIGDNYYKDGNSNYFELTSTPPSEYVDWFLMMVNVANDNGLIVFSTLDHSFYFPDRTSNPENARAWLEKYVAKQNQPSKFTLETIANILQAEKKQKQNKLSPYLSTDKEIGNFIVLLLKDFLQKNGIKNYEILKVNSSRRVFNFAWFDTTIFLEFDYYILQQTYIKINSSLNIKSNVSSNLFPIVSLRFNKYDYENHMLELTLPKNIRAKGHKSPEFKKAIEKLQQAKQIFSVTQLYQAITEFFDIVQQEVLAYHSFYDMIDAIVIGKSEVLHQDIWQLEPTDDSKIYRIITVTRHVQHPKLQEVLDKGLKLLAEHNIKLCEAYQEKIDKIMDGYEPNTAN